MRTALRRAWLPDGSGGMFPDDLHGFVPVGRSGLLVGRIYRTAAAGLGTDLFGSPGPMVEVPTLVEFVDAPSEDLAAAAVTLSGAVGVTSVVVCPAGAPPQDTALAAMVATVLENTRGRTAVTCGVELPALGGDYWQRVLPVFVEVADGKEVRQVWELGSGRVTATPRRASRRADRRSATGRGPRKR